MTTNAYVVTEGSYSEYRIVRVFLDKDAAEQFVVAYNAADGWADIEEWPIGGPAVDYDGPYWIASWWPHDSSQVGPSPGWWSGEALPKAKVRKHAPPYVLVHGTSKEHVEKALYDAVAQFKAERAGIV